MPFELPVNPGDHPAFVRCVQRLVERGVTAAEPERIHIARVDNWFGERWYGFRGKVMGAAGFRNKRGYKRFIVPPFVPERVLCEWCYARTCGGEYAPSEVHERLAVHQKGGANLRRWLDHFTDSGLLVWFSGNSAIQDMASAMLYVHTPDVTDAWYLGIRKDGDAWQFQRGIEITKREFEVSMTANTARPQSKSPSA